jgi:SAM-dependent methyltransferase
MRNTHTWQPTKFSLSGKAGSTSEPASRIYVEAIARIYLRLVRTHARGRLLDLGCGHVPLYGFYKDLISNVTCADWPNSCHQNSFLDLALDISRDLPFQDESFDTVIRTDVLEHLPEPQNAIYNIARVLAPNGKLILGVPFQYQLHEEPLDFYRYTEFALRRFASLAGLDVIDLSRFGGAPEVVADISTKVVSYFSPLAVRPYAAMASLFLRIYPLPRLSRFSSVYMPLGYAAVFQKPHMRHLTGIGD